MLSIDRDALICDIAETYGIYDWSALSVETLAALSCGLDEDSRIKSKIMGIKRISKRQLLASIADSLICLRYYFMSQNGDPKPTLFETEMYAGVQKEEPKIYKFASSEEFKKIWSEY